MNRRYSIIFALSILFYPFGIVAQDSGFEAQLNTANTISAAFELRKLSESLAPGVDTRCYIAKLAAFQAASLPKAANVIANYPSGNSQSDAFAIQSSKETMELYNRNRIQEIASQCQSSS